MDISVQGVIILLIIFIVLYILIDTYYFTENSRTVNVDPSANNKKKGHKRVITLTTEDDDSEVEVRLTMNNTKSKIENFRANGLDNPVIDQGTGDNAYALLNQPLSAGGQDTLSHRLIVHQVSNKELIGLITEIEAFISNTIIDQARTCQDMHGDEVQLHDGKRGLSLACVTDPYDLRDQIIDGIYEMIYQYVKSRFGINMNPYVVYHDLHMHLGLMEGVIYPLQYSGLYTVHGVQYTNEDWIRTKVHDNIDVRHVLFTVLSRRNIEIEVDTDQHVH